MGLYGSLVDTVQSIYRRLVNSQLGIDTNRFALHDGGRMGQSTWARHTRGPMTTDLCSTNPRNVELNRTREVWNRLRTVRKRSAMGLIGGYVSIAEVVAWADALISEDHGRVVPQLFDLAPLRFLPTSAGRFRCLAKFRAWPIAAWSDVWSQDSFIGVW